MTGLALVPGLSTNGSDVAAMRVDHERVMSASSGLVGRAVDRRVEATI